MDGGTVTLAVLELIAQMEDPDLAMKAKAALALRLAQQLDAPDEGRGIASVARELRFLLQELAATKQSDQVSRLDTMLGRMAKPSPN